MKKTRKKHSWKKVLLSPEIKLFFTHAFFGNALPKYNARALLKQRKKRSGLKTVPALKG